MTGAHWQGCRSQEGAARHPASQRLLAMHRRERLALAVQLPLQGFTAAQQATQQCAGTRQQVAGPTANPIAQPVAGGAAHLPMATLPRVLLSPCLTGLRETLSAVRRLLMPLLLERSTSAAAVLGLRTGLPLRGGLAAPISPFLLVPGALSAAWAAEALASASSAASTRRTCKARLQNQQCICHQNFRQRWQSGVG